MRIWREIVQLLLPTSCCVCGAPTGVLCQTCVPVGRCARRRLDGLECVAAAEYTGAAATVMREYKQHGVTALARDLADLLMCVAKEYVDVVFVPIPTRPRADRERGYRPVEMILKRAGLPFTRALIARSRAQDQRGLSVEQRRVNAESAFRPRGATRRLATSRARVVLVDDVVTTGATLDAAAAILRRSGVDVVGAITVLSTPKSAT